MNFLSCLQAWFESHQAELQQNGFLLSYQQSYENQTVKTNIITVERCKYVASITLWETGACNFVLVNTDIDDTAPLDSDTSFTEELCLTKADLTMAVTGFFDSLRRLECT